MNPAADQQTRAVDGAENPAQPASSGSGVAHESAAAATSGAAAAAAEEEQAKEGSEERRQERGDADDREDREGNEEDDDDDLFNEDEPVCPTCGKELLPGPDAIQHIQMCSFEDYMKSTSEMLALQEQTINYHEAALEVRDEALRSHAEKYEILATKTIQQQELIELQARQIDLMEEEIRGLKTENIAMRGMLQKQLEMSAISERQTAMLKELVRMKDSLITRHEEELRDLFGVMATLKQQEQAENGEAEAAAAGQSDAVGEIADAVQNLQTT